MQTELSASVTQLEASQIAAENIVSQLVFFAMLQDPSTMSDPLSPIQLKLDGDEVGGAGLETVLLLATQRMEAAEA
jgi:hypothetical protein